MDYERPRSQSVLQIRPSLPSRASKLIQKVSNFRGRLRLPSRNKAKDDPDILHHHPYPSQTHHGEDNDFIPGRNKPYMSQPMLGLGLGGMHVEPFNPDARDDDDSYSLSASPSGSEYRRHLADLAGAPRGMTIGAGRGSGVDGLPPLGSEGRLPRWNLDSDSQHQTLSAGPTGMSQTTSVQVVAGHSRLSSSSQCNAFDDRPSSSSGMQTALKSNSVDMRVSHQGKGSPIHGEVRRSMDLDPASPVVLSSERQSPHWNLQLDSQHQSTSANQTSVSQTQTTLATEHPRSSSSQRSAFDDRPRSPSGAKSNAINLRVSQHSARLPLRSEVERPMDQPPQKHRTTPSIVVSSHPPETSSSRNSLDNRPLALMKSKNDGSSDTSARLSPIRIFTKKPSRTRLKDAISPYHDGPASRLPTSTSTSTSAQSHSRTPSPPPPLPTLPSTISYAYSTTTSLPALPPTATTARTLPTRRETAPRLTLPNHSHRISLTLNDGTNARLSPSVILRPPPLPILNLPTLPTIPRREASSSVRGPGLRSMPELPHEGTEVGDDEDDGDDREGDDEDDDEDADSDADEDTTREGASSLDLDDERPSMSSSNDYSHGLRPYPSQHKTHSRSSSYQSGDFPSLPGPDTSRIDLSFLDQQPPSPPAHDRKGKGRARYPSQVQEEEDTSPTPTSVSPSRDYFTRGSGSYLNDVNEGAVHVHPRNESIGARTPRAEDAFLAPIPLRKSSIPVGEDRRMLILEKRPGMYKHASRSLIDIHAVEKKERVETMVKADEEAAEVMERFKRQSGVVEMGRRGHVDPTDAVAVGEDSEPMPMPVRDERRGSKAPAYESLPHALRRRRSMPTFTLTSDPPPYPSFHPQAHPMSEHVKIQPRDDEGYERLPPYTNEIYIRSIVPRKMEFTGTGKQAKDRKWRRVLCVLEGTVLKVYRCPAGATGVSALGEWWEKKVGVGDVSASASGDVNAASATGGGPAAGTANGETAVAERVPKLGEEAGTGQTELVVSPPIEPPASSEPVQEQQQQTRPRTPLNATRSRLNIAVNLLRPSRPHGRSISDMPNSPPKPRSPRASLNLTGAGSSPGRENGGGGGGRPRSSISGQSQPSSSMPASSSYMSTSTSDQSMTLSVPSPSSSSHSSRPNTASSFRGAGGPRTSHASDLDLDPADLIRSYTMQHAESGLGNDYIKRRNVIRVRVEGEQFLIQARDVAEVVAWIEALQASANVALDLDERPMPKGPLFPRRRRRRLRPRPATDSISRPIEDMNVTMSVGVGASISGFS